MLPPTLLVERRCRPHYMLAKGPTAGVRLGHFTTPNAQNLLQSTGNMAGISEAMLMHAQNCGYCQGSSAESMDQDGSRVSDMAMERPRKDALPPGCLCGLGPLQDLSA